MVAGDACRGTEDGTGKPCPFLQPCPHHKRTGRPRINRLPPGTEVKYNPNPLGGPLRGEARDTPDPDHVHNVTSLFSGKRDEQFSFVHSEGGKRDNKEDPRPRVPTSRNIRPGKRWSEIYEEVKRGDYTWEAFAETLDAEELARGQLKDKNGGFQGRPPEFIPRQFLLCCHREMFRRFNEKMQTNIEAATDELIRLGLPGSPMLAKDRVKVLQYIIERVMGKIPDKVEITAADPWETIIGDILSDANDDAIVQPRYMKRIEAAPDGQPQA